MRKNFCHLNFFLLFSIVAFLLFAEGCISHKKCLLTLSSLKDQNCGGNSCVVYIYQLKDSIAFITKSPDIFWKEIPLGFLSDTVGLEIREQIIPLEQKNVTIVLAPNTRFIGIAADFACANQHGWRQVYSVAHDKKRHLFVDVGVNTIGISTVDKTNSENKK